MWNRKGKAESVQPQFSPATTDEPSSISLHSHGVEHAIRRRLLEEPGLNFSSLVVRRIQNGICLEGIVETDECPDLREMVQSVSGVTEVLNHVMVRRPPNKG